MPKVVKAVGDFLSLVPVSAYLGCVSWYFCGLHTLHRCVFYSVTQDAGRNQAEQVIRTFHLPGNAPIWKSPLSTPRLCVSRTIWRSSVEMRNAAWLRPGRYQRRESLAGMSGISSFTRRLFIVENISQFAGEIFLSLVQALETNLRCVQHVCVCDMNHGRTMRYRYAVPGAPSQTGREESLATSHGIWSS